MTDTAIFLTEEDREIFARFRNGTELRKQYRQDQERDLITLDDLEDDRLRQLPAYGQPVGLSYAVMWRIDDVFWPAEDGDFMNEDPKPEAWDFHTVY